MGCLSRIFSPSLSIFQFSIIKIVNPLKSVLRLLGSSLHLAKCFPLPTVWSSLCQVLCPPSLRSKSTSFCSVNMPRPFPPEGYSTRFFLQLLKCLLILKLHSHSQTLLLRLGFFWPSYLKHLALILRLIVLFISFQSSLFISLITGSLHISFIKRGHVCA